MLTRASQVCEYDLEPRFMTGLSLPRWSPSTVIDRLMCTRCGQNETDYKSTISSSWANKVRLSELSGIQNHRSLLKSTFADCTFLPIVSPRLFCVFGGIEKESFQSTKPDRIGRACQLFHLISGRHKRVSSVAITLSKR